MVGERREGWVVRLGAWIRDGGREERATAPSFLGTGAVGFTVGWLSRTAATTRGSQGYYFGLLLFLRVDGDLVYKFQSD